MSLHILYDSLVVKPNMYTDDMLLVVYIMNDHITRLCSQFVLPVEYEMALF